MGFNTEFLKAVANFHQESRTGSIGVQSADGSRALLLINGQLVMVDSSFEEERLGRFLVREGLLDASRLELLITEAQRTQRLMGAQIIADGLLRPTDLASALERQGLARFDATLKMAGQVKVTFDKPTGQQVMSKGIGAVTMEAFRSRIPLEDVHEFLLEQKGSPPRKLDMTSNSFAQLSLMPAELRACRRLAAGESREEVALGPLGAESTARLASALVALEHWA